MAGGGADQEGPEEEGEGRKGRRKGVGGRRERDGGRDWERQREMEGGKDQMEEGRCRNRDGGGEK